MIIRSTETDLLVRASRLYYLEDRGQAEIARLLRISRPGVSRLLRRAREAKIVEIRVRETPEGEDWSALGRRLGVKELLVSPHSGLEGVGRLGARLFERTVRAGDVVGITAGMTLAALVQSVTPPRHLPIDIVPLVGALWDTGEDFDCSFLCQELRRRTGGTHRVLSAPAVVRDEGLMRSLCREPRVRRVLDRYPDLDSVFFGIGVVSERHPVAVAAKVAAPRPGRLRATEFVPRDAVASVACLFFDARGRRRPTALDRRTLGISHEQLAAVPTRVALAAGTEKFQAALAVARAGLVDALVIDAPLARALEAAMVGE